jgi:PAS domain S-box-containing protein
MRFVAARGLSEAYHRAVEGHSPWTAASADAALVGTWDWDLTTDTVRWSENLARIHGLPAGAFDGTFASDEREIHPDDRVRVLASARRAIAEGVPHEVEYRIVAPDGTVRWVEGKGRVEYEGGRAVRMAGVCVIVTRRKEAESARLAALEETGRLKDDFLAVSAHARPEDRRRALACGFDGYCARPLSTAEFMRPVRGVPPARSPTRGSGERADRDPSPRA